MNTSNILSTEIVQIPSQDNHFTAIVKAVNSNGQSSVEDFGIATALSTKTEDVKIIVDTARDYALERVQNNTMSTITHNQNYTNTDSTHIAQKQGSLNYNPPWEDKTKTYNHSPNKPISSKQIELLTRLAKGEQALNIISQQKYNKAVESLSSKEANELIQYLKQ